MGNSKRSTMVATVILVGWSLALALSNETVHATSTPFAASVAELRNIDSLDATQKLSLPARLLEGQFHEQARECMRKKGFSYDGAPRDGATTSRSLESNPVPSLEVVAAGSGPSSESGHVSARSVPTLQALSSAEEAALWSHGGCVDVAYDQTYARVYDDVGVARKAEFEAGLNEVAEDDSSAVVRSARADWRSCMRRYTSKDYDAPESLAAELRSMTTSERTASVNELGEGWTVCGSQLSQAVTSARSDKAAETLNEFEDVYDAIFAVTG